MTSTAIDVSGLSKLYGETLAVDNISVRVAAGSITALLGGNGAGKTTTISMLLGLLTPSTGKIAIMGEEMPGARSRVLARMNFGSPYVDLPKRLTVRQNLDVFARLYGIRDPGRRIGQLCEELALGDFIDRPTGKLSSGQGTRVALAKALINAPDLLLLDEPTASLDPDTADWVRGYLEAYRDITGATILLASHNMTEVERMCDTVLMMKTGRVVDRDSPAALVAKYGRETLEQVFLDIARSEEADAA